MLITLLREWWAIDGAMAKNDPERRTTIVPGTHEFVRIRNPYGYPGNSGWFVLKGTMIGAPEQYWKQWVIKPNDKIEREECEVVIDE